MSEPTPFLTAEWRHLAMLNYQVDREIIEPLVPAGTGLDGYQGKVYVSLVAFLFQNTRLKGVPVPFHQNFEEVNLRFYVRRFSGEEWRRGVVFIKEIVPKTAVAAMARWVYNENYVALPMRHRLDWNPDQTPALAEYEWEFQNRWCKASLKTKGEPARPRAGSLEEFITEHYWGYARQKDGGCVEYQVQHPPWRVWQVEDPKLAGNLTALYGETLGKCLEQQPSSAFLAEGSAVTVFDGTRIV